MFFKSDDGTSGLTYSNCNNFFQCYRHGQPYPDSHRAMIVRIRLSMSVHISVTKHRTGSDDNFLWSAKTPLRFLLRITALSRLRTINNFIEKPTIFQLHALYIKFTRLIRSPTRDFNFSGANFFMIHKNFEPNEYGRSQIKTRENMKLSLGDTKKRITPFNFSGICTQLQYTSNLIWSLYEEEGRRFGWPINSGWEDDGPTLHIWTTDP